MIGEVKPKALHPGLAARPFRLVFNVSTYLMVRVRQHLQELTLVFPALFDMRIKLPFLVNAVRDYGFDNSISSSTSFRRNEVHEPDPRYRE